MLGRGVKRKWSCLEELEAEELPEKEQNGEEAREQEEEQEEQEEEDGGLRCEMMSHHHLQQRQRVLGLCLEKLQHYQAGVELSLRRSVLLINTLRRIHEDMRSSDDDGAAAATTCSPGSVHPDSSHLLRDDFRDDMPVTCPGCADGDEDDDGLSLSLSPEFLSQEITPITPEQQKPPHAAAAAATASAFTDAVNAMGYLSDLALDVDIFEDIDTSMYETSDLPPSPSGSLWPPVGVSVSLWTDEDTVKMRPPPGHGHGHGHGHGSPATLQSCLMDLNELDHIMEILVKS